MKNICYCDTNQLSNVAGTLFEVHSTRLAIVNKDIQDEITSSVMNKIFGEGKSLFDFEKIATDDLYSVAHEVVQYRIATMYQAAREAGDENANRYYDILNQVDENWDSLVAENKELLKVFGVEFDDNTIDFNDSNRNSKDYDKDYYKIDPIKSATTSIKMLLATLTEREFNQDKPATDVFGIPNQVVSTIGGGRLIPFAKVFVRMMDTMKGAQTLTEMVGRLVEAGKADPNLIPLFSRLGGQLETGTIDYSQLDYNQWRLLMNFYSAFSKQQPVAMFQYVMGGVTRSKPAAINDLVKVQVGEWEENIKGNANKPTSPIVYDARNRVYTVKKSQLPKQYYTKTGSNRANEIKFLDKLGIHFTQDVYDVLSTEDRATFNRTVRILYKTIQDADGEEFNLLNRKYLAIEGDMNKLARLYIKATNIEPFSVFFDENGEYRQNYVPNNRLSVFTSAFNHIDNLDNLGEHLPHVAEDVFATHSLYLKKGGNFFDGYGNRLRSLSTGYIMANINEDTGFTTSLTSMTYGMRLGTEINQNLNGWYYSISSVDSNTEHMIDFGNPIDFEARSNLFSVFSGYLRDEIALIDEAERREQTNSTLKSNRGTERGADKLRFMGEILSEPLKNKLYKLLSKRHTTKSIDKFISDNRDQITEDVNDFINNRAEELKSTLIGNGVIEVLPNGLYNWEMLDITSPINNKTIGEDELHRLLTYTETNYIINNIEQHKLFLGDPFQRKAKDEIKRSKLFNSPRGTTYHESEYDNNARISRNKVNNIQLKPTDVGYVHYDKFARTTTLADIQVAGQPYFIKVPENADSQLKEALNHIKEEYKSVDETDSGAYGMPWFFKQLLEKTGQWDNNTDEKYYQWDMANARLDLEKSGNYVYSNPELKLADKELIKNKPNVIGSVKKPIVSGPKYDVPHTDIVLDKYSVFPITWELTKKYPSIRAFFIRALNTKDDSGAPIDYGIFLSGRKVGSEGTNALHDSSTGEDITSPFEHNIQVGYDTLGIISEVSYHEGQKITQGTQLTNLATMDLMEGGVPRDIANKVSPDVWNNLTEEEKLDKESPYYSPLYAKINRYNKILRDRVNTGFNSLLRKWGVKDMGGYYDLPDKTVIAELLQNEMFRRLLPNNVKDALRLDANNQFVLPPEATNAYRSIKSILMSQIDKAFISPKINGLAAVEAPATLFNKDKRAVTQIGKSNVFTADTLKFYEPTFNEDGSIKSVGRCEIILSSQFFRKATKGRFDHLDDDQLLKELNKNPELIQGIGFRIPTSGINLVEAFTIKELLPSYYGDTVIVPAEITKKTGIDFNVDKYNMYLRNLYIDGSGNIVPVKYFNAREEHDDFYGKEFDKILSSKIKKTNERIENADFKLTFVQDYLYDTDGKLLGRSENFISRLFADVNTPEDISILKESLKKKLESSVKDLSKLTEGDLQTIVKQEWLDEIYDKAQQNEFIRVTEDLILEPTNFARLITPNDTGSFTNLRDELNDALGKVEGNKSLLNRSYLSTVRHNNLIGKTNVGVYSLSLIYNTIMQQHGAVIDVSRLNPEESFFIRNILASGPKMNHKTLFINGNEYPSLSNITDTEGEYISDNINQVVTGAVDMPTDQFLSELGFVEQRGPIAMAMLRLGVPKDKVVWFINQPIIREYIEYLNSRNTKNLLIKKNIDIITARYCKTVSPNIDESKLKSTITHFYKDRKSLSPAQKAQQRAIFEDFLYYATVANYLLSYNQGLNYDRANFSDTSFILDKEMATQRAIDDNIITSAKSVIDNTFLGDIQTNLQKSRRVLATVMKFEEPAIADVLDEVKSNFFQKNQFINAKVKQRIGNKVVSSFIDYLVQNYSRKGSSLSQEIDTLLVDPSTNIAERFQEIKNSLPGLYPDLAKNPVIRLLNITSRTPDKVKNLAFPKKQIGTNEANILTEGFRELRDNIYTRDIYQDIVKLGILQSGLDNSPISFTSLIPLEDYSAIVLPAINNISDINSFLENNNFFRNNWKDNDIVPTIEERYTWSSGLVPYGNVPEVLREFMKPTGTRLIGLRDDFNSGQVKYPFVKVESLKKGLTQSQIEKMRKVGDYSYWETTLYQRVQRDVDTPLIHRLQNGTKVYIYKPVNAWGDGYFAREHYLCPRSSVLENNTQKIKEEIVDGNIIQALIAN